MNPVHELIERLGSESLNSASPPYDPIASALADVAAHYGAPCSASSLAAGLPLANGRLAVEHLDLAAERAGLALTEPAGGLARLAPEQFPVIVTSPDGTIAVVWHVSAATNAADQTCETSAPGKPAERTRTPVQGLCGPGSRCFLAVPVGEHATPNDDLGNWFIAAFRGSARTYALAILATLAVNLLALALPLYTMNVYDRVVPNGAVDTLIALSLGVLIATVFDLLIRGLRSALVDAASRRADVRLANRIFARMLGARLGQTQQSAGARANTLREFETLRELINSATLTTLGDLPFVVVYFATIAVIAGPLVLVALAFVPLVLGLGLLTERRLTRRAEVIFRQLAHKQAVAVETLVGLETLKAAGAESFAASRWERAVADSTRTGIEIRALSNHGVHGITALGGVLQVAMVATGFFMVTAGGLTSGALIATMMLVGRAIQPLSQTAILLTRLQQARQAWRALDDIMRSRQERPTGARFLTRDRLDGRVEFDGVTYAYEKNAAPALRDVSFSIEPGERVGIIGGIGSGKSTILRLLAGLSLADSGRVLIDRAEVGQFDPAMLRREAGLAMQGAELFQGTIRSNIALAEPQADEARILRAARLAGALDWIERLPTGLDTPVRERGLGLSRGQRQSVTLARALLRDPRLVLLDEPTSDMDPWTESQVVARLKPALAGRTLIVVTHRPAPLDLVDRLIVLDSGRKVADGPRDEVMRALRNAAVLRDKPAAAPAANASRAPVSVPLSGILKGAAR